MTAIPVIDAHHHIWRQADLPWLQGPMQPRIFGAYEPIRRDYLIDEYRDDIAELGVVGSVYVQANWPPERFEEEVAWVDQVANDTGWPQAVIAFADMTVDDARPQLDRLATYPRVRGIRQQFHWHTNELYRFANRPDLGGDRTVQCNIARLADYGFSFDLQVFSGQMADAADLTAACPDVTFVLQHAGMLEDLSEEGRAAWRGGMGILAAQPNVVSKLSALGTFIRRNDAGHINRIVSETIGFFGAERCLFGSNFPIEKLWTDYGSVLTAYRQAIAGLGEADQHLVFHQTAERVYRLDSIKAA